MHAKWLKKAKTENERQARQREVKSFKPAFDEILELLESLEEENLVADYDSPSWAYRQADRNGANRKLAEIRKILTL